MITSRFLYNTKYFLCLLFILIFSLYSLNYFNKIFQCALVFTIISVVIHLLLELYSQKVAMFSLFFGVIVSVLLLWSHELYIHNKLMKGIVFASFISIMLSMYCSTSLFLSLKNSLSFLNRFVLSLFLAAAMDAVIMSIFFINNYSTYYVVSICLKEFLYKFLYSSLIYLSIFFIKFYFNRSSIFISK